MDRGTLVRFIVIAGVMLLAFKFWPALSGRSGNEPQPIPTETYVNAPGFVGDSIDPVAAGQTDDAVVDQGETCSIAGNKFVAELSTRGAGLRHFYLTEPQYKGTEANDMSTTPDVERWRSLRTLFRGENAQDQIAFDRFNWQLEKIGTTGCKFTYRDSDVEITKVIQADDKPYELTVETTVKNIASAAKTHQFEIQAFAYRQNKETKSHFGRVSPFMTELSCAHGSDVERKGKDDSDFKKHGWWSTPGIDRYGAISNYYFAQALVPLTDAPTCRLLAEDWYSPGQSRDDDDAGSVYHLGLTYAPKQLQPNETSSYKQIAFFGPKDRDILAHAGADHGLSSLINLGFFSPVAKYLVLFLSFVHDHVVANWGVAIIVMTLALRLLLFPLTYKSIQSTIGMRKLKPEMDAIALKYKDDMQQKNLATMELYRQRGVSPFGGCLPQMIQMPVWVAMYTTLQTAVEMYHTKFLWFTDLSAPDKFYILPIFIGALYLIQARIMPQQPGMDPVQQKMMMYVMPLGFTVMMLFLPAALGVYMMTNTLLGITQQLVVEKIAPSGGDKGAGDMPSKAGKDKDPPALKLGKGNASV
ncbi:MAG TPA: membrane protein insertase YidC [Polyangiaceae bacterium]